MDAQLVELRARAQGLLQSQPAETTPEAEWLAGELHTIKDVIVALIDYLSNKPE